MPVETLVGQNFQRHGEIAAEFDAAITTIVGDTDAGKSSLLRMLRWVCLNLPSGDGFIRRGSDGAVGKLHIDGHTIKRTRLANGTNTYELDGEELVAFGTGVPSQIAKLLQVDKINFVGQKEPDFWFALSPAEVSRQLNSVVDLGVIDETNERIGKKVWSCQEAVRNCTEELATAKALRSELDWVVEADKRLTEIEEIESGRQALIEKCDELRQLVDVIKNSRRQRAEALAKREEAARVGRHWSAWMQKAEELRRLSEIIENLRCGRRAKRLAAVDSSGMITVVEKCRALQNRCSTLRQLIDGVRKSSDRRKLQTKVAELLEDVAVAVEKYKAATLKMKSLRYTILTLKDARKETLKTRETAVAAKKELDEATQGRCPVCGGELQ